MKIDSLSSNLAPFADDDSVEKKSDENLIYPSEQEDIQNGRIDEKSLDVDNEELPGILERVNQFAETQRVGLRLKVDDDTKRIVVSMVDSETGDVIRQMPSEHALKLAKEIDEALQESSMPRPEQLFSLFSEEA